MLGKREIANRFDRIDGTHPWRTIGPLAYVDYRVHYRPHGHVLYFNFDLAKEMGLCEPSDTDVLTHNLEQIILNTFSLQIINEWDLQKGKFDESALRPGNYMATRYLQQQHRDKRGSTSGDGRSIWNGCIEHKGQYFDISSRGTGATCLSPGVQEAGKAIKTGDTHFGYASGLADTEEMMSGAVLSEVFHRRGIPTERCLAVIDYPDGSAIGVRAAPNLIRPAHIFRFLKLGLRSELQRSLDLFISRQIANQEWALPKQPQSKNQVFHKEQYQEVLKLLAESYGRLAALLEDEYIFSWFSWDGDNLLANGALLDYGSIRQFAARHDKYRYEDVDRFSASLPEQKRWLRLMVQIFAQAIDYILSGKKKKLQVFQNAPCLQTFDRVHQQQSRESFLWRLGFDESSAQHILKSGLNELSKLQRCADYFEKQKTIKGPERVPDGLTHRPIFILRNLYRELPADLLRQRTSAELYFVSETKFCDWMSASYATKKDLLIQSYRSQQCMHFQELYYKLIDIAFGTTALEKQTGLSLLTRRSKVINFENRLTGDGLTWIIKDLLKLKADANRHRLLQMMELFIESQVLIPGRWKELAKEKTKGSAPENRWIRLAQRNLQLYRETV